MKKKICIVLILLLVLAMLLSCAPATNPETSSGSNENYPVAAGCTTGVHYEDVPVTNERKTPYEIANAYLVVPNEGCNAPILYCTFTRLGYGAAGGCVTWE